MTGKQITFATVALAALVLARILLNLVVNPYDDARRTLAATIDEIPSNAPLADEDTVDYARLTQSVASKPALWRNIVDPAPPPPPPPPPAPSKPDLEAMLRGVTVGREQIGDAKIKIFTKEDDRGEWIETGGEVNGCTLVSFTRDEAVFAFEWKEGGETLEIALPRQ